MESLNRWEAGWAPYDEATYRAALGYVRPDDVVLEIGAGDLRLARRLAGRARQVYAIECQPALLAGQAPLPDNLMVLCADARQVPWPPGITLGILLMRHCTHVGLYGARLRALGCRRLVTNARWGMDVELMNLEPDLSWTAVDLGWYACLCGATGFVPGPPDQVTEAHLWRVTEVSNCPACGVAGGR